MTSFRKLLLCLVTVAPLLGAAGCKWLKERFIGSDVTVEIAATPDGRPRFAFSGGSQGRGATVNLLTIKELQNGETVCSLLVDTLGPAAPTYLEEWKYGVRPAGYRMQECDAPLAPGKYRLRLRLPGRSPYWDFEIKGGSDGGVVQDSHQP